MSPILNSLCVLYVMQTRFSLLALRNLQLMESNDKSYLNENVYI